MEVVPLRVLLNGGDEFAVDLDRSHGFSAGLRAGKRKSALIRKAVQDIQPASKAGDLAVVIDLIEVKTGLLPREQLDLEPQTCHLDLQFGWDRSVQCAGGKLHTFSLPNRYV